MGLTRRPRPTLPAEWRTNLVRRWRHAATTAVNQAWPIVERAGRLSQDRRLDIDWSDVWGSRHDAALDALPDVDEQSRRRFRILGEPTDARKRHAIVTRDGGVFAVVSLRRRPSFWEPVSYACIPGTPVPCVDDELGTVLRGLGLEVRLGSVYDDPTWMRPQQSFAFPRYGADLTSDFEKFWPMRGGMNYREARKKTKDLDVRIDHPGDIDWTVNSWAERWTDDGSGEIVSAADRKRLWNELQQEGVVHSVVLADAGHPVAGAIHYCVGGVAKFECTGRDDRYDKRRVGSRVLDVSFQWAAEAGYETFDLGGGTAYKHWWAPVHATSYAATFRPRVVDAARRIGSHVRASP